jgi:hypothetical protein
MPKRLERDRVVQTGLRIRTSLRDKIEKAATQHGVSLNHELVRRLEVSFREDDQHTIVNHLFGLLIARGETVQSIMDGFNKVSGRTRQLVIELEVDDR